MGMKPFHTDALDGLCSKDQQDVLDAIDSLRSQGIDHYVSLPQIIVCGDQSSGKSSVLEAISGVPFPIKSDLCTRFPTELVLRTTPHVSVCVSIVPHRSYSESEQISLRNFRRNLDSFDGFPDLIESAKSAMAISTPGRTFSKNLLRIEISGPDQPHLTIVDLPGLIHFGTKQQSDSDVDLVKDVVQEYMRAPRSIILAVVSAKNDYNNQIVLQLACDADKEGTRTLGIITKPDTLLPGSKSEATYASIVTNKATRFRLGWHFLKNMDSEKGRWSLSDRDSDEERFFSQGIWNELARSLLGIKQLRERLSRVLLEQIAAELPSLISDINSKSNACRSQLNSLGEPRATSEEQRSYLLSISQSFQSLAKAAVDGTYNNPFFEDPMSDAGYHKRMRAWMYNLNQGFAKKITKRGHRRKLTDSSHSTKNHRSGLRSGGQILTTRAEYLNHIQELIQRTRGRELPGTFNPMIVADLFLEQSSPWDTITRKHIEEVWKAAREFLNLALTHVADDATSKTLLKKVFKPSLDRFLVDLKDKTKELLEPHETGHPITHNRCFTENLQKVRNERARDENTRILEKFFKVSSLDSVAIGGHVDLRGLITALSEREESDINRLACSEALECMETYYKIALERFIDDVTIKVVEDKLISKLDDIFSPITVCAMSDDLVNTIAGESEENRSKREQLKKQLDVFAEGSEICKRFSVIKTINTEDGTTPMSQQDKALEHEMCESDERSDGSGQEDTPSSPDGLLSERPEFLGTGFNIVSSLEEEQSLPSVEELDDEPAKSEVVISLSKKKPKKSKAATKKSTFENAWD